MTLSDKKLLSFWQISFVKIKICPSSGLHADTVSIINLKNIRISSPTYPGMPILHQKCSVTDKKKYFDERKLEKKYMEFVIHIFQKSCIVAAQPSQRKSVCRLDCLAVYHYIPRGRLLRRILEVGNAHIRLTYITIHEILNICAILSFSYHIKYRNR